LSKLFTPNEQFVQSIVTPVIIAKPGDPVGQQIVGNWREGTMTLPQRLLWVTLLPLVIVGHGGCAVQYYDEITRTDHLWGVGHFKMKVVPPQEGVQAMVKGTAVIGASLKIAPDDTHLMFGWDETSQMAVTSEGASVRFEWPSNDLFSVRVGAHPPFGSDDEKSDVKRAIPTKGESQ
jgi:hypothetical protein